VEERVREGRKINPMVEKHSGKGGNCFKKRKHGANGPREEGTVWRTKQDKKIKKKRAPRGNYHMFRGGEHCKREPKEIAAETKDRRDGHMAKRQRTSGLREGNVGHLRKGPAGSNHAKKKKGLKKQ